METKEHFNLMLLQVVTLDQYQKMQNWPKLRIWEYIADNWPTCYTVKLCRTYYTKRDLLGTLSIAEYLNRN